MTPTAELSRQSKTTLATRRFESPSSSLCGRSASARPGQQTLMILQSIIDSVFSPYLDRISKPFRLTFCLLVAGYDTRYAAVVPWQ